MREIISWSQLLFLPEPFRSYLLKTRESVEQHAPWDFEQNGHWIIVDEFDTLEHTIKGSNFELPSIDDGLLEHLEAVISHSGVLELTFIINNEFSISILILEDNVSKLYRSAFEEYFAA